MVWGIDYIGSGMFSPHGGFPGEKERLNTIGAERSEEERARLKPHEQDYGFWAYERILKDEGPLAEI